MSNPASSEIFSYLDILFFFLGLAVAGALYFFLRFITLKFLTSKGKPVGPFFSRLALPGILLFITLCFKIKHIKDVLPLSQKFFIYLNAAFFFFIVFFLIRLVDASLQSVYFKRRLPFPLPKILHGLILGILYLIILFAILKGIIGINITPFLATSAILTMILGLAFQGVLSNVISGISLHFTRSFGKGDWIQVGSNEGKVIDTNWRETRICDRFSNIIVLPNNIVASERVTNFSLPDKKTALNISVKASYEAPPTAVLEALREAASDVPKVLASPAPEAYALSYDDFGISYLLKFWITDFDNKYPILGEVGRIIWYKFKRRSIEIPVPLSDKLADVFKTMKEREGLPVFEDERERTFHDLLDSSFLRFQEGEKAGELLVSEDEIRELASLVRRAKFAPGEVVFKQGEKGESCFVVAGGRIRGEIVYEEKGKEYKSDFRVEAGGIFGEMSLFTGMPRTATGIVEVESELLEIKDRDFAWLLERNPTLADVVAGIVSTRNKKNQEFLKKIKELSDQDIRQSCSKRSILKRLKSFIMRKT